MKKFTLAMLVLAVAASSSYGAVVYSWENDLNGWDLAAVTVTGYSATGATDGSVSLELVIPGAANSWSLFQVKHSGFPAGLITNGPIVSFDITTSANNVWVGQMIQGGGVWYASGAVGFTNCSSTDGSMVTTTVSYDFSAAADAVASGGWAEHRIIFRGDNSGNPSFARTIFIDNYRITPEPAMMSLLGLGGLALLRRRK
jgi:hypothetical protein